MYSIQSKDILNLNKNKHIFIAPEFTCRNPSTGKDYPCIKCNNSYSHEIHNLICLSCGNDIDNHKLFSHTPKYK